MSYDNDKVKKMLDQLSPQKKYETGLQIIKKILKEVEKLKPIHKIIDAQFVDRSDLATKQSNTKVKKGCESFLNTIGFFFTETTQWNGNVIVNIDGEIGGMAERNPDAENICTRFESFIGKQNNTFQWYSALNKGFVDRKQMTSIDESREVDKAQKIMKIAVENIWNAILEFRKLKISEL
jgi:lysyl-tRNA synthetase class II